MLKKNSICRENNTLNQNKGDNNNNNNTDLQI